VTRCHKRKRRKEEREECAQARDVGLAQSKAERLRKSPCTETHIRFGLGRGGRHREGGLKWKVRRKPSWKIRNEREIKKVKTKKKIALGGETLLRQGPLKSRGGGTNPRRTVGKARGVKN